MKGAKDMTEKEVIDAIEYMLEVRNNTIIRLLEETTDLDFWKKPQILLKIGIQVLLQ